MQQLLLLCVPNFWYELIFISKQHFFDANLEIQSWSASILFWLAICLILSVFLWCKFQERMLIFSSTNIFWYHFSPQPWCTWFTIFVIMSVLLYCPVTCMSGHDKCEITQFNGAITCRNFYLCILWRLDWTCFPRPSFNNKTLAPSHSNPFVAMLKGFSVTAMKYL